MSDDSEDHFLDEIVQHVQLALETIHLDDVDVRDSIVEGLRDALETVVQMEDDYLEPGVVVLEGGRSETGSEDACEEQKSPRPELRVVSREDDVEEFEAEFEASDIRVKVFTPQMLTERAASRGDRAVGSIAVSGQNVQTIYRGDSPATYRIFGSDEILEIGVNGEWVERINPGQSLDISSKLIWVRSPESTPVVGAYIRL